MAVVTILRVCPFLFFVFSLQYIYQLKLIIPFSYLYFLKVLNMVGLVAFCLEADEWFSIVVGSISVLLEILLLSMY